MQQVSLDELHSVASENLQGAPAGPGLTDQEAALLRFGLAISVTSLSKDDAKDALSAAIRAGATVPQLQEVASLISGLGVHTLMMVSVMLARESGQSDRPLTTEEAALWERYVGNDPFWNGFEEELPGFLDGMLRLSSGQFKAFFEYCAVPWKSGTVRARLKELIAMASDATPAHRFMPGFRLHLKNAIALGASDLAVRQALDLAAASPEHRGLR